jgi:long-subunit fatty acid transport protein
VIRGRQLATLAFALALAPSSAFASGGSSVTLGNEAVLTGGALVAAGRGGSMAWYNPAGLGANRVGRVEASAQLFGLRMRRIRRGLVTELPDGSHSSPIRSRDLLVVPNSTVWVFRAGPRASIALSMFVPSFDELDIDTFASRRYTSIEYAQQVKVLYQQRRYDIGPSFGIEITPRVRVGAGAFVVYERTAQSSRAWAWGNDNAQNLERFVQTGLFESVRSWGTEFVAGVQWQPTDSLHLGLAIRSPRLWFVQRATRSTIAATGGYAPDGGGYGELTFEPTANTGLTRRNDPITATAGIAWEWDDGVVALEADASPARKGDLDDGQRATWAARLGVRGKVSRNLTLGAGTYTQRSPLVVADDFLDFDVDVYGFTFGGELRRPVRLGKRERARRIVFTSLVGVRYALSVGTAGRMQIDLGSLADDSAEVLVSSGAPVPVRVHDLALQLGTGLEF